MPTTCFISHAFRDAEIVQRLLKPSLPKKVKPVIFPPITVPPDQVISAHLIKAVLDCDGLIYLTEGFSAQSFWVAFERDYALRAKKKVFAFDSHTRGLHRDTNQPMDLPVFSCYAKENETHVKEIIGFLGSQRFFQWEDQFYASLETLLSFPGLSPDIAVQSRLTTWSTQLFFGGYVVLFWSKETFSSSTARFFVKATLRDYPDRIVVGLLDTTPLDSSLVGSQARGKVVQLFGDEHRSERQRIDDLIVRLYWLIYRNTQQRELF